MAIKTKNLGLIKAIHVGVNPPLNTKILWFNDSTMPYFTGPAKIHYYYDVILAQWMPLKSGGSGNYTYNVYASSCTGADASFSYSDGIHCFVATLNSDEPIENLPSVVYFKFNEIFINDGILLSFILDGTPTQVTVDTTTFTGSSLQEFNIFVFEALTTFFPVEENPIVYWYSETQIGVKGFNDMSYTVEGGGPIPDLTAGVSGLYTGPYSKLCNCKDDCHCGGECSWYDYPVPNEIDNAWNFRYEGEGGVHEDTGEFGGGINAFGLEDIPPATLCEIDGFVDNEQNPLLPNTEYCLEFKSFNENLEEGQYVDISLGGSDYIRIDNASDTYHKIKLTSGSDIVVQLQMLTNDFDGIIKSFNFLMYDFRLSSSGCCSDDVNPALNIGIPVPEFQLGIGQGEGSAYNNLLMYFLPQLDNTWLTRNPRLFLFHRKQGQKRRKEINVGTEDAEMVYLWVNGGYHHPSHLNGINWPSSNLYGGHTQFDIDSEWDVTIDQPYRKQQIPFNPLQFYFLKGESSQGLVKPLETSNFPIEMADLPFLRTSGRRGWSKKSFPRSTYFKFVIAIDNIDPLTKDKFPLVFGAFSQIIQVTPRLRQVRGEDNITVTKITGLDVKLFQNTIKRNITNYTPPPAARFMFQNNNTVTSQDDKNLKPQ